MNVSSDSSNEDEPLVTTNCSEAVNNSSVKSESEENGYAFCVLSSFGIYLLLIVI